MSANSRGDLGGRIVGMLVFVLGVALLIWVFAIAYGLFHAAPAEALGLKFTGNPKTDPTGAQIGTQFGLLLFRVAYLFLMSISGSLIAQKGTNLYFSAVQGIPVNVSAKAVVPPSP